MNASFRLLFGPGYTEKAYFLVQKVAKKHGLRPKIYYFLNIYAYFSPQGDRKAPCTFNFIYFTSIFGDYLEIKRG